ncbi:MAG: N-acetyl-gamma-glutamyl-phosphate reductase [Chloroflexi bacterium]|nr:N-acetyl-gamma-glutamyl-phosphate reductase [Chloroflexota bacterium]
MTKAKVGIINVTGYAGVELARILARHPEVSLVAVTGRSAVGQKLGQFFLHLADIDLTIEADLRDGVDIAFSALPHKASAEAVAPLVEKGVRVVDTSADFRLKDVAVYQQWYGVKHPAPEMIKEAVYGLTELHRPEIPSARVIANPGCYPTSAILALAPLVREGLITGDIIVDSKSGVSGAGRTLDVKYHFSEANENVAAYGLDGHRHLPEITQELALARKGFEPRVTFIPHLIPMTRGILSTCYAFPADRRISMDAAGKKRLAELFREAYKGEPFVRVMDAPPGTKLTLGNNMCLIYPTLDTRAGRVVVVSCLDNLVKGAAGQAVHNMNLMLGLPETTGLEAFALYP